MYSVAPFLSLKERKINDSYNENPGMIILIRIVNILLKYWFIGPGAYNSLNNNSTKLDDR